MANTASGLIDMMTVALCDESGEEIFYEGYTRQNHEWNKDIYFPQCGPDHKALAKIAVIFDGEKIHRIVQMSNSIYISNGVRPVIKIWITIAK